MIPRRRFFYLRHGETDWNAHGRAQGRSDIPLNGTGRAQAREAAARLAGRGVGRIVASPLARARETASIVAEALDLPIEIDVDLQEVDFGAREGARTVTAGRWRCCRTATCRRPLHRPCECI